MFKKVIESQPKLRRKNPQIFVRKNQEKTILLVLQCLESNGFQNPALLF